MEFLRRVISNIKAQLAGLNTSQKMVLALLSVILLISCFWMANVASQQEMVSLYPTPLTNEKVTNRIIGQLDSMNKTYELDNGNIRVLRTEKDEIKMRLASEGNSPEGMDLSYEEAMGSSSLLEPAHVYMDRKLKYKQAELAKMIKKYKGVETVDVIINEGGQRRLNNVTPVATASVMITTYGNKISAKNLAGTVASQVSGAVPRLKRQDVKVVVDGKHIPVLAEDEQYADDKIERKNNWEFYFRNKVVEGLQIANAIVQVDIQPDDTEVSTTTVKYMDPDKESGSVIYTSEKVGSEDLSENIIENNEPGIIANASEPSVASGSGNKTESSENTTKSVGHIGKEEKQEFKKPGDIPQESRFATVTVPWDYFKIIAKNENGTEDPKPDELKLIAERELPTLKKRVMAMMGVPDAYAENIQIFPGYFEGTVGAIAQQQIATNLATQSSGSFNIPDLMKSYGKEIAISTLALVSLLMALMMVRKAAGPVEVTEDEAAALMSQRERPMDVIGLEEGGFVDEDGFNGLLSGMELDEDTVRSQQILQQIKEMIEESPESAAILIGNWISQES
ncbi:MAG: hypothetical protein JEZ07_07550 [Phycisphaerae bacterium]|nr:hypothetical protein [Phycisphaerae bacterium]